MNNYAAYIRPVIDQLHEALVDENMMRTNDYSMNAGMPEEGVDKTEKTILINRAIELDKSGIENVTDSIQRFISLLPTGYTVRFDTGTYRISNLTLKTGITYDFGNSTIISDNPDHSCMQCLGEHIVDCKLVEETKEYSNVFTLSSVENLKVGQIISFKDKKHRIHEARRYYYYGFNTIITSIDTNKKQISTQDTIPYKLYARTTACAVFNPATCAIRNVKDCELEGIAVYPSDFISIKNGLNCLVENVNTTHGFSHVIKYASCVNCAVKSCNVMYPVLDVAYNADHPYFVAVLESTNTLCDNITGINAWHVVVTSPYTTCLNTHIVNCNCISTVTTGIQDHENAYGTIVESCVANRIGVSGGATIKNCTVYDRIYLVPESNPSLGVYTIENCKILEPDGYAIRVGVSPKIEGGVFSFESIRIKGLSFSGRTEVGFIKDDYDGKSVIIEDCENLWFDIKRTTAVDSVRYENCRINMDVDSRKTSPTLAYYFNNLSFRNCTFYSNGDDSFFGMEQTWKLRASSLLIMDKCRFDYNKENFVVFIIDCDASISNCMSTGNITASRNIHFLPGNDIRIVDSDFYIKPSLDIYSCITRAKNFTIKSTSRDPVVISVGW